MNEQLTVNRKATVNWPRYLLLAALVGSVMGVIFLALTAVSQPQATVAQGGGIICGVKFNDLDGDGVWNQSVEPTMPGWTIQLVVGGGFVTATTDATGHYCFDNLADGDYTVQEVNQPEWTQTFPPDDPAGGPGVHTVQIDIQNGQGGGISFILVTPRVGDQEVFLGPSFMMLTVTVFGTSMNTGYRVG